MYLPGSENGSKESDIQVEQFSIPNNNEGT